jgi:hypothetical protein
VVLASGHMNSGGAPGTTGKACGGGACGALTCGGGGVGAGVGAAGVTASGSAGAGTGVLTAGSAARVEPPDCERRRALSRRVALLRRTRLARSLLRRGLELGGGATRSGAGCVHRSNGAGSRGAPTSERPTSAARVAVAVAAATSLSKRARDTATRTRNLAGIVADAWRLKIGLGAREAS